MAVEAEAAGDLADMEKSSPTMTQKMPAKELLNDAMKVHIAITCSRGDALSQACGVVLKCLDGEILGCYELNCSAVHLINIAQTLARGGGGEMRIETCIAIISCLTYQTIYQRIKSSSIFHTAPGLVML